MYLIFDTSVVIEIERENKKIIKDLNELKKLYPSTPKLPFIVYYELIHGIRKRNPKNKVKAEMIINAFEVLHTTNITAKNLSILKSKYELSLTDLMIASQVMEKKGVLVTRDKDFKVIDEIEKIFV